MSFAMPAAAHTASNPSVAPFSFTQKPADARSRLHHPGPHPQAHLDSNAPGATGETQQPGSTFSVTPPHGRLHEDGVADADRHAAIAMHLSPLSFIWIGPFAMVIPLVLWLVRKDHSRFADDHGRETVNFMLSFIVLHVLLAITIVGALLIPVLWVVALVGLIRGGLAASRNEYFRYPVNIRFL